MIVQDNSHFLSRCGSIRVHYAIKLHEKLKHRIFVSTIGKGEYRLRELRSYGSQYSDAASPLDVEMHFDWICPRTPGVSASHPLIATSFVKVNYAVSGLYPPR